MDIILHRMHSVINSSNVIQAAILELQAATNIALQTYVHSMLHKRQYLLLLPIIQLHDSYEALL